AIIPTLTNHTSKITRQHPPTADPRRRKTPLTPSRELVRRLLVLGNFHSVLLLPVADGGLDGILGEHGAVNLNRRQRELADDVRVLDGERFFHRLALHPFRGERRTGDGRAAAEGLELGFFNDLRLRID